MKRYFVNKQTIGKKHTIWDDCLLEIVGDCKVFKDKNEAEKIAKELNELHFKEVSFVNRENNRSVL